MQDRPESLADRLAGRPVVLLGCGHMGGALLAGWLAGGVPDGAIHVLEPAPRPTLRAGASAGRVILNPDALPAGPAALVIAVKPQQIDAALPVLRRAAGAGTPVLSIAAGITLARIGQALPGCHAIRAMPNTPAAIGAGISALVAAPAVGDRDRRLAEALLAAAGGTVWLADEAEMDAVTAVSGSGPAYVFALIEALAAAGEAEGLAPELAAALARQTVIGAGALAGHSGEPPAALRRAVTSPGGTTAAGLVHLLDAERGLLPLLRRTVGAAARRSRELADS